MLLEPTEPMKTGYTFARWFYDDAYNNEVTFGADTVPANDITLYAKFTANDYTITFDSKGGSDVTSITQDYQTSVSAPTELTKTGYTFLGWIATDGSATPYVFGNYAS